MNIQLFLADQELELNEKASFPLNKTYENLSKPTDIIVDYSKSINIPITTQNNKIFANAYRLDKKVVTNSGEENIGMHLNPSKRIPFKMTYNGSVLLEGYAKFASASYSNKNKYYTINLFGAIGEVFQELLNVVTDNNKLNGLDGKYVLNDSNYLDADNNELNSSFVRSCWEKDDNVVWNQDENQDINVFDMYGFAPSHRGLYNEFKSNKIQMSSTTVKDMSQHLKDVWNDTNDTLGADNIVGDGFYDYQMNQFRANRLKPFVYFNHIMRMYVDKCKELTNYDIVLDKTWFNENNPYWAKLCYTLDFLDLDLVHSDSDVVIMNSATSEIESQSQDDDYNSSDVYMKTISSASDTPSDKKVIIDKFNIGFGVEVTQDKMSDALTLCQNELMLMPETQIIFTLKINRKGEAGLTTVHTATYWTNGANNENAAPIDIFTCSKLNFLRNNVDTSNSLDYPNQTLDYYKVVPNTAKKFYYVTVPSFLILGDFPQGYQIDISMRLVNNTGGNGKPALFKWAWCYTRTSGSERYRTIYDYISGTENQSLSGTDNPPILYSYIDNTAYIKNWRNNMTVNIANLYQNEEPLFKVVLEYTKMFGLVWDVDYNSKTIYLKTKQTLFSDIEYVDWTDKLDCSKEMKIEPITFDTKAVLFNYNNTNGFRYSGYRDKYGINIGEKKLYTGYEFNTTDKKLFDAIDPSSMSSKSYIPYNMFLNWNTTDVLTPKQEQRVLIDCENEDEKGSISINNWYFRGTNIVDNDVIITDDTALMTANKEYFYIDRDYALTSNNATNPGVFPTFSTAIEFNDKIYCSLFNTPNVDYTYDKLLSQTINTNIYELFWRNYINEKYNVENKKVTAYFNLSNVDYNQFRFNKLVILNNQLFIVNKIIDFNINNIGSTKCELIQVSDLSGYTTSSVTF